eukprot:365989-Chlamydomonas_euryale.AAC.7
MQVLCSLDRCPSLVLQAPPGAGKTTVVPLAMLRHRPHYLTGAATKILVLEPRCGLWSGLVVYEGLLGGGGGGYCEGSAAATRLGRGTSHQDLGLLDTLAYVSSPCPQGGDAPIHAASRLVHTNHSAHARPNIQAPLSVQARLYCTGLVDSSSVCDDDRPSSAQACTASPTHTRPSCPHLAPTPMPTPAP